MYEITNFKILFKNIVVVKDKERLRSHFRSKVIKEK